MKFVKMFLALVGLAVLFVFVRDNTGKVVVKFWDYATPEIELFLVLIITFVLGMIAASFGSTLKIMQLKRQLRNVGSAENAQKKSEKKAAKKNAKPEAPVPPVPVEEKAESASVPEAETFAQPVAEDMSPAKADAAQDESQQSCAPDADAETEVKPDKTEKESDVEDAIILPAQEVEGRK